MKEATHSDLSHWCERGVHTRCRDYEIIERSHEQRIVDGVAVVHSWRCACLCHKDMNSV